MANCDPQIEGGFFVKAMEKQMKAKLIAAAEENKPMDTNMSAAPQVSISNLSSQPGNTLSKF